MVSTEERNTKPTLWKKLIEMTVSHASVENLHALDPVALRMEKRRMTVNNALEGFSSRPKSHSDDVLQRKISRSNSNPELIISDLSFFLTEKNEPLQEEIHPNKDDSSSSSYVSSEEDHDDKPSLLKPLSSIYEGIREEEEEDNEDD